MLNIHLYPSPLVNESRIMREAMSLSELCLFERIDLVGVGRSGLPGNEKVQQDIRIVRVGLRDGHRSLLSKISDTVKWSISVFLKYRNQFVGCINCHSVAVLPLSVLLKYVTGAKLVYDAHELETEANGLCGVRKWITKHVERALIQYADHCIFVGRAIEEWYIREYGLANTTVIYNCPRQFDAQQSNYFRETFLIPSEISIFLYQGVIAEGRGIKVLVDAFSRLEDRAALVVMGYGPLTDWVIEQTEKFNNIYFNPAVSPDKLLGYTCASDFGLSVIEASSMSYEYCMPNKLFEYVMAMKPVLVSPNVEQRGFVERYGVGEIVDNISSEAIRLAARKLMDHSLVSYKAGLNVARVEYCWENQEKKLEQIYCSSLKFSSCRVTNKGTDQ